MTPYRKVPRKFATKGVFWWRTAMISWLHQLNSRTEKEVGLEALKKKIGFKSPIIGVHVRHGDACHTTSRAGKCKGLQAYMASIKTMADKYNTTRVYLATDDQSVINEAKKYSNKYQFVYMHYNRGVLRSRTQIEYRFDLWNGRSDVGHGIMISALQDTLLLADADYLVSHQLSNLSRLALELSSHRKGRVPPYISMDGGWCWHWRMRKGCMGG